MLMSSFIFYCAASINTPSIITLVLGVLLIGYAFYMLIHVPEFRRREMDEIENSKRKAKELMDKAIAEKKEADSKWSTRAFMIECQVKEKFKTEVDSALKKAKDSYDSAFRRAYSDKEKLLQALLTNIQHIINESNSIIPNNSYTSQILTDIYSFFIHDVIEDLNFQAPTTASYIKKKFNDTTKKLLKEAKFYKYQTTLYESLLPDLNKLAYFDLQDFEETPSKSTEKDWLSQDEYDKLSTSERSQLALDRYILSSNKTRWQVGRDYELYIGFIYKKKNFDVDFIGIEKKLEDMGRDLICHNNTSSKSRETHIVQCKCWSTDKLIHEKHITQLYGTSIEYAISNGIKIENGKLPPNLKPVFITSTHLSDTARTFANILGVVFHENVKLPNEIHSYPRIKCNQRSSNKIYHLPFDQMYDRTIIDESQGDFYAFTVAEAEAKGFRHALHWSGNMTPSQC